MKQRKWLAALLCCLTLFLVGCSETKQIYSYDSVGDVPPFSGEPYVVLHDNKPQFDPDEFPENSFESYSKLDALGRCGVAVANVGVDLMPTEDRGSIGNVKPTGWKTAKYDHVDGKYLYNRCHLIGYQLSGENANEQNLITGTRYLNVDGMLPFENEVADYVKDTKNHVLYRVTPIFEDLNLVASGVQIEAMSREDDGKGVCFNVYVYNNQPGVTIDYATGNNWLSGQEPEIPHEKNTENSYKTSYVLNTKTKKIHLPDCASVQTMKNENKEVYQGKKEDLLSQGYEDCGQCKP